MKKTVSEKEKREMLDILELNADLGYAKLRGKDRKN